MCDSPRLALSVEGQDDQSAGRRIVFLFYVSHIVLALRRLHGVFRTPLVEWNVLRSRAEAMRLKPPSHAYRAVNSVSCCCCDGTTPVFASLCCGCCGQNMLGFVTTNCTTEREIRLTCTLSFLRALFAPLPSLPRRHTPATCC